MAPSSEQPLPVRQFDQNFLSMPSSHIDAISILESDARLKDEVDNLLNQPPLVPGPRRIGLAGGYSPAGRLVVLAVSVQWKALFIQLRASKGKPKPEEQAVRDMLQRELLCREDHHFYAFDFAPLAFAMYFDQRLRIHHAIDIQSACESERVVADAVAFAVKSTTYPKIHRTVIENAFRSDTECKDPAKPPAVLAFKAWLPFYLAHIGDMEARFAEVPPIHTDTMEESKLAVLAQFGHADRRLDAARPGSVVHEFSTLQISQNKSQLQSERFQNRVSSHAGGGVRMTVTDSHGAQYTVSGTTEVDGRRATVKTTGPMEGKTVVAVRTVGAEVSTMADQKRAAALLEMMQEKSALFESPFIKTLYPDGKDIVWPDTFTISDSIPEVISPNPKYALNDSQSEAVSHMLTLNNESRITIIQGPPGTGKTSVITAFVLSACQAGRSGLWLCAQSNVAVRNIAEKLATTSFTDWKLLVSKDFKFEWHDHLYKELTAHVVVSDRFKEAAKQLQGCKVVLCTLSMLSHPKISLFTSKVPIHTIVIDEASQIKISDYLPALRAFPSIQKLCFIGDDKQLPPYGQESIEEIQSIFEISHLRSQALFLDMQFRMPPQVGEFISDSMYDGQLRSNPDHGVDGLGAFFVHVEGGKEKRNGTSWENIKEREIICKMAAKLQEDEEQYRIITPYDAQRSAIEQDLKNAGVSWHNKCFNVDSFQGNEEDYIIISLVRSQDLGFLKDLRRTNVMLSRCKKGMFICTSWEFLMEGIGKKSLVGRLAAACVAQFGAETVWLSRQDIDEAIAQQSFVEAITK